MKMNKALTGFVAGCVVTLVVTGGIAAVEKQKSEESYTGIASQYDEIEEKINLLDGLVEKYYLNENDNMDTDHLVQGIYAGYMSGFDEKYTRYYSPEEYSKIKASNEGVFYGMGVLMSPDQDTGIITLINIFKDGGAYEAGIQKDDILYKVEDQEVTGMDTTQVVAMVKGEEGTTVNVTVYRRSTGEYLDFSVTRKEVTEQTITYGMLEDNIGYIYVTSFADNTDEQFIDAVDDLESQGMTGLMIDLRDNLGGSVESSCAMLDRLLPDELYVYTIDKDDKKEEISGKDGRQVTVPMVVLVNGNSASASEIFAGAMKDYGAATLVGETTYGKGIVQVVLPMSDGSAVQMTMAKYYTPNGVCIHGVGIEPDVEAAYSYNEGDEMDAQSAKALEVIKEKIQ